jgi:hypothetical protein
VFLLFLSLRNLFGAGGVVLLVLGGVRLYPFLRRVLMRGFRRFVPHDPKGKVHDNRRQPGSGGVGRLLPSRPMVRHNLDAWEADFFMTKVAGTRKRSIRSYPLGNILPAFL